MPIVTKENGQRTLPFDQKRLDTFIDKQMKDYPNLPSDRLKEKIRSLLTKKDVVEAESITQQLILESLAEVDITSPDWTFVSARVLLQSLYHEAAKNRAYDVSKKYGSFYGLLKTLGTKGVYSSLLLKEYTKEEIEWAEKLIDPTRDHLFTYIGLKTLADRYLATDKDRRVYELPQERWLVISMVLMSNEPKEKRMTLVKEAYWALSNQYMTVATPTLANAGKAYGQLSSCFIDTVEDSLEGIYNSNTDVARLSKNGGGIGVYMGFVRSRGSDIKGFKNASSGVVPWIKQLNNTAVSVDQLGTRKGSIAVYLDAWHKDIFAFLDLRLNNGDERLRAHDIFTGIVCNDLFMETVEKRGEWYLFDPHEVHAKKGWYLQDFYDETRGKGSFREKYTELVNDPTISKERVQAIDIMKSVMKSQLETGTPYMFYKDEVNRKNANKHAGVVYCSNLCTEITQNQSVTRVISEKIEDGKIVVYKEMGDFVVCNLSSIHLGNAVGKTQDESVLERLIPIQVRMLDNVIDLNTIEVLQAAATNEKYRAIGLGTFGWHTLLALRNIQWESEEAVDFADKLYEEIAYLTIKASRDIAIEKGSYKAYPGSGWQSGDYFSDRGYTTKTVNGEIGLLDGNERWYELARSIQVHGMRNGYLMAIAPNASTAILTNASASTDPIFSEFYYEEKKDYKIPVVAPHLDHNTYNVYRKTAYKIDQRWSVKQTAARQKHIDQAISFNLYVPNTIKASVLLDLHLQAWKGGLKTTYYVRSTSSDVEECEWCSS